MHEVDNTGADEPPTQEPSASEDIPVETPTSEDHQHQNTITPPDELPRRSTRARKEKQFYNPESGTYGPANNWLSPQRASELEGMYG